MTKMLVLKQIITLQYGFETREIDNKTRAMILFPDKPLVPLVVPNSKETTVVFDFDIVDYTGGQRYFNSKDFVDFQYSQTLEPNEKPYVEYQVTVTYERDAHELIGHKISYQKAILYLPRAIKN
jgi:hypothetical protein